MKKLLCFLLIGLAAFGQNALPDAPQPQDPPQTLTHRSWHDTFRSRSFWAAHGAFLAANVFDIEATHQGLAHHRCVENSWENPRPSRGDLYKKDMPFFFGFLVADLLLRKAGVPIAPYAAPAVGTGKHLYGGTKWLTQCW